MNDHAVDGAAGDVTAVVDHDAFQALDATLGAYLAGDGAEPDLASLRRLLRQNPIERDPLAALGTTVGDNDLRERLAILRRCHASIQRHKDTLRIGASLLPETFSVYIPIARFLAGRAREIRQRLGRAGVFGINGGQGSGKTTINAFLQIILQRGLGLKTTGFSIDDVYKTYDERQAMASAVHPLFAVRSVAGTHDTMLARDTLTRLMQAGADTRTRIPRFDKTARAGHGDRAPPSTWPLVEGPVDVVIFEGWFVGARAQPPADLAAPVNDRERIDDPDGTWRTTMNHLLATDYRELFDLLDELLVIQVRSMSDVFRNRELQEQHLRRRLAEARHRGEDTGEQGAMSPEEVVAFIGLYERTTRHMLQTLPAEATLTLFIGDHHRIERMRVNAAPPAAPAPAQRPGHLTTEN
jgi:D-glycerate 3-kinase